MSNWETAEALAYNWFKENIDSNAMSLGGQDSTVGDIYSPLYDAYIEVKDITNGARCGQFTESTIKDNPYASAIYSGEFTQDICSKFVQHHYAKKGVNYFIVINNQELSFYTFDEFFSAYTFEVQKPYEKRSGTRSAPKKDIPILLNTDSEFVLGADKKVYCNNKNRWGEYVSVINTFDYFIGKNAGELRKRSNTTNMTWHLLIKQ